MSILSSQPHPSSLVSIKFFYVPLLIKSQEAICILTLEVSDVFFPSLYSFQNSGKMSAERMKSVDSELQFWAGEMS